MRRAEVIMVVAFVLAFVGLVLLMGHRIWVTQHEMPSPTTTTQ